VLPGAHYRAVTALRFSDDGAFLVSGGDDAAVRAWRLRDVLLGGSSSNGGGSAVAAAHTWSDHTLPVTDVHIGTGGAWARVYTASADRTVRVCELATGVSLHCIALPADISALAVDLAEQVLFAGSGTGAIFRAPLQPQQQVQQHQQQHDAVLLAHTGPVHAVALSPDSGRVVSVSADATLKVWDAASAQCLRSVPLRVAALSLAVIPRTWVAGEGAAAVSWAPVFARNIDSGDALAKPVSTMLLHASYSSAAAAEDPRMQLAVALAAGGGGGHGSGQMADDEE
jgi:pre-rRNA-processing protein IPI3